MMKFNYIEQEIFNINPDELIKSDSMMKFGTIVNINHKSLNFWNQWEHLPTIKENL